MMSWKRGEERKEKQAASLAGFDIETEKVCERHVDIILMVTSGLKDRL